MADYDMTATAPPPPPPPSTPPPPPAPPTPPEVAQKVQDATAPPPARPVVNDIEVTTRRAIYDEAGNTVRTVEIRLRATPDADRPASESLDRLWLAANTKAQQYLQEATR